MTNTAGIMRFIEGSLIALYDKAEVACQKILIKSRTSEEVIAEFLKKYPEIERWRLFVDGIMYAKKPPKYFWPIKDNHLPEEIVTSFGFDKKTKFVYTFTPDDSGWLSYEAKESGSVKACLYALHYALQHIHCPRNEVEFIKTIHQHLIENVKLGENIKPGQFKGGAGSTFLKFKGPEYMTAAGIKDLMDKIADESLPGAFIRATTASKKLADTAAANPIYQDIIKNLVTTKTGKCIYNAKKLAKIKEKYPQYYDQFLSDLSETILYSHCTYYAAATKYTKRLDYLISDDDKAVEEEGLDKNIIQYIDKQYPTQFCFNVPEIKQGLSEKSLRVLQNAIVDKLLHKKKRATMDCSTEKLLLREISDYISQYNWHEVQNIANNVCNAFQLSGYKNTIASIVQQKQAHMILRRLTIQEGCQCVQQIVEIMVEEVFNNYHQQISQTSFQMKINYESLARHYKH